MADTVCDAGPLIHLDELDCLDLMEGFGALLIPATVWHEARQHRPHLALNAMPGAKVVEDLRTADPALLTVFRSFDLDRGERAAFALLAGRPDALFLCDDSAARLAAESLGYAVRGTIGLIVRALRRGTRTRAEVHELLTALPVRSTLHLSPSLLQRVISELPPP